MSIAHLLLVCFTPLVWGVNVPGVTPTETFKHSTILDANDNYVLFWNFNDTHVTFETHVRTRGWVGFGLSTNGKMFPADVIVGWVNDDGTSHFSDRHTVGHSPPVMDNSQDWHLLLAQENDFGTVLKFVRKINTCDDNEDEKIQEGTSRVIFAYGTSDPANENSVTYHGTTRGTKSISLLSYNSEHFDLPDDIRHFDVIHENYTIPNDSTTYWCTAFKLPIMSRHHMVKYEAILTPGNELNVHHIVLYRCKVDDPDFWNGKSELCYAQDRAMPQCTSIIIAWAIGGEPFYLPKDVGFPVGDDGVNLYILETHYDNPTRRSGAIDNSGIRITITPTLRKYEAGVMEIGHTSNFYMIIPPGQKEFISKSYCSADCLSEGFRQKNLSEITVVGAFQHSHLLGRAITTRHFRNGVELKPLIQDPYYDFDFQEVRLLPEERTVLPGDSFQVECNYNSEDRNDVTFGGLSTREEMCLTFIYYYPATDISFCLSQTSFNTLNYDYNELFHVLNTADWNNQTVSDYYVDAMKRSYIYDVCMGDNLKTSSDFKTVPTPQNLHSYVEPASDCS
ncbi:hypothetical protein ACF0H5_021361 [Mactra antiquata]